MPKPSQIKSAVVLLWIAGLTSGVAGQGEKPERPKEANIESLSADIDPSLRSRIAAKLKDQIEAAQKQLTTERASLKQLREKLQGQEEQVRQLDLKVQYLQDRLAQWSPDESQEPNKQADAKDDRREQVKP